MNDDDLDRALRAARPGTHADGGWAASADGDRMLTRIRHSLAARPARPHRAPLVLGLGLATAVATVVAVAVATTPGSAPAHHPDQALPNPTSHAPVGPVPSQLDLVAYESCPAMLAGLRAHTAAHVTAYGLPGGGPIGYASEKGMADAALGPVTTTQPASAAPDHSTTNVQETGVGEPDTVETDGRRVVSVDNGVLRVVDATTRTVTGRLDLTMYAGAESAQLLMQGDRVLVLLGGGDANVIYGGPYRPYPSAASGATFLLVDLAATPKIVATLHPNGGFLDARMVDGTVRLVVQSTPKLSFPTLSGKQTNAQRIARNRAVVAHAPLSAWLPSYDVTTGGTTSTHAVPCTQVSHPASYTGMSMLSVYSVALGGSLDRPEPISIAADGTSVYASTSSLYVASSANYANYLPRSTNTKTQLHRFDITGGGRPAYLGSGSVPGALLDSYSMSEYDGSLRVVTTSGMYSTNSRTSVYVLNADTLHKTGSVGGLGVGESLHAVRFLGPLAYVVTFRSVDPLYVLDLHDPANPRRAGELTVTGYSDYLHPVGTGRLLGVGETVNSQSIVTGLQVSLFDVSAPTHPQRLARVTRKHTPSETPLDPHAFLYWPATKEAIIPIDSWNEAQSGAVVVVRVGSDALQTVGTIRNPAVSSIDSYNSGIERTLVIGDEIWTMSSAGLQVSDLGSLARQAWIPFS